MAYKTGNANADTAANTLVTGGEIPDALAAIDMQSTDKGLLLPRLTTSQRDILVPPSVLTYPQTVIADGAISYFRYGELIGNAIDEIGLQNQGYLGTPTLGVAGLLAGDPDTAVQLNIVSKDYVESLGLPGAYSFTDGITDSPFVLEAWVNVSALAVIKPIISKTEITAQGAALNEYQFSIQIDGSIITYVYSGTTGNNHSWSTPPGVVSPGTTYHIVTKYGGAPATGRIIVDSVEIPVTYANVGSYSVMPITTSTLKTGVVFLNNNSFESFFDGVIDEVAIYNTLTDARVLNHYNIGSTP